MVVLVVLMCGSGDSEIVLMCGTAGSVDVW